MSSRLAIVSLVLLAGCIGPLQREPTVTFHAAKQFTNEERKCLEVGAANWYYATDGLADARFVYDYDQGHFNGLEALPQHTVVKWSDTSKEAMEADEKAGSKFGLPGGDFKIKGQIDVHGGLHAAWPAPIQMALVTDRMADFNECTVVVTHELGHVWGLNHTPDKSSIMYYRVDPSQRCLTDQDMNAFCEINDCSGHSINSCKSVILSP